MSEVLLQLFSNQIQENLYPANEFYKDSEVDGGIASDVEKILIPQAGQGAEVVRNNTVWPLSISERIDDRKEYDPIHYITKPIHVTNVNQAMLSYDKRASVLKNHLLTLNTAYADDIAYGWSPTTSSNILRSTGTGNVGTVIAGMTGSRKELIKDNFADASSLLDQQDIPMENRKCLIYAQQYAEIRKIQGFVSYLETGYPGGNFTGEIGMLMGFKVYRRSRVTIYNSTASAKNAVGAAVSATDNLSVLFWHPSFVRRCEGNVNVMAEFQKPAYGGSIMNAEMRGGGVTNRLDEKGVVVLVQQS